MNYLSCSYLMTWWEIKLVPLPLCAFTHINAAASLLQLQVAHRVWSLSISLFFHLFTCSKIIVVNHIYLPLLICKYFSTYYIRISWYITQLWISYGALKTYIYTYCSLNHLPHCSLYFKFQDNFRNPSFLCRILSHFRRIESNI